MHRGPMGRVHPEATGTIQLAVPAMSVIMPGVSFERPIILKTVLISRLDRQTVGRAAVIRIGDR